MRRALAKSIGLRRLARGSWTPALLFAAGEAGVWYDPSDSTTVWQDSARTTPALANDPVGAIDDKSGNGFHALQATSSKRPLLRMTAGGCWYLESDGLDDFLKATFTYTQPMERISSIRPVSSAQEFGGSTVNKGVLQVQLTQIVLYSGVTLVKPSTLFGVDVVITERHNGANSRITYNNVAYTSGDGGTDVGGGVTLLSNFDGTSLSEVFMYGMVMGSFNTLSDTQIQQARNFMAVRAGIML